MKSNSFFSILILLASLLLSACQAGKTPRPTQTATATATAAATLTQGAASPTPATHTATTTNSPHPSTPTPSPSSTAQGITVTPSPTPRPNTPTPSLTPSPSILTICLASEPSTLFIYGLPSYESRAILDAIQDGPVATWAYTEHPVLFEELPTLENGGVITQTVSVHTNERYVDASGNPGYWLRTEKKMEQLVVTFHLKAGLQWSNGTPLTADDFRFGYEIARDRAASASLYFSLAERTASFAATDEHTLRWVGLPGYVDPDYAMHFFPPVSRQAYGSLTPEQMLTDAQINTAPLGWGPFRIVNWSLGDRITLERNPYYFRASEGLPYMDGVVYRFMAKDLILAAVTNGDCDIGAQDNHWDTQLDVLKAAQSTGPLAIHTAQSGLFEHLDFDLQPADDRPALFAETSVRQAVAYCLDRQAIIDQVLAGLSAVPDSFLPPEHPFYNPQVTRYPFDPAQGRALLQSAGWTDTNSAGLLEQDGIAFSATLVANEAAFVDRVAPLIARQLRENCGLDIQVEFHSTPEIFGPFPEGLLAGHAFDLAEFSWTTSLGWQPCEVFNSDQIPDAANAGGINYSGYANTSYDAACQLGNSPVPFTRRQAAYRQAQAIFTADLPSLPLFWQLKITIARPEVTGLDLDPSAATEFWNLEQIKFDP